MKYLNLLVYAIMLSAVLLLTPNVFAANIASSSAKFADDEIIIKLKPSAPSSDIHPLAQAVSGELERELLLNDMFLVKIPKGTVEKVIKTLSEMPQVATATPNFIAQKQSVTNDPSLQKEWGLFQVQAANSSTKSAWDKTTAKPEIKIAVLDTGIEKTHPDLENNIVGEKNFSSSPDVNDHDGHGTQVAGVIAAIGNNASGIAGIAYKASLLNVKVLNDDGFGTYANIADGILWAANSGAKVINLGLGGSSDSDLLKDAVNYAADKGAVVIAAAGNYGANSPVYPAEYDTVLSVAAADDSDSRLPSSNYGPSIKVAAPGNKIYSTDRNNSYTYGSGTSFAAAFASGVAALVWSTDICATSSCVMDRIEQSTDKVAETGKNWKYGRINALKAVTDTAQESTPSASISTSASAVNPTIEPELPPVPQSSQPIHTPTPTVFQKIMTVANVEMWTVRQFALRDMFIRVTVVRQSDKTKVANAFVTLDLSGPDGSIYTGISQTDSQGQVTFGLKPVTRTGIYKAHTIDIQLDNYVYKDSNVSAQLITH